jgi:hypothetical protein
LRLHKLEVTGLPDAGTGVGVQLILILTHVPIQLEAAAAVQLSFTDDCAAVMYSCIMPGFTAAHYSMNIMTYQVVTLPGRMTELSNSQQGHTCVTNTGTISTSSIAAHYSDTKSPVTPGLVEVHYTWP